MQIDEILIPDTSLVCARAIYLGDRIDLKAYDRVVANPGDSPFRVVAKGFALVFRYGSVVTFRVDSDEERDFLSQVAPYVSGPVATPITELANIVVTPEAEERPSRRSSSAFEGFGGDVAVRAVTNGRLQIIGEVLAKSIALQHFEERAARTFDLIEPLAQAIKAGHSRVHDKQLFQLLSDATVTLVHMAGRVEIREKPDIAWDKPELDRLYEQVSIEYELRDRDVALTRKLELISQTTDRFFHISQARRTHRVEWYITFLIIIEIVLGLLGAWG